MAAIKHNYRRPTADEFSALLAAAGLSISQFLYLTGRRRDQIEKFMRGSGDFTPTMGDVLVVELAKLDVANIEDMEEIVAAYHLGKSVKGETS